MTGKELRQIFDAELSRTRDAELALLAVVEADRGERGTSLSGQSLRIVEHVADYFGVQPADIRGACREQRYARPRFVAWALIRERLRFPYPRIARLFNRDHSSIIHGVRRADRAHVEAINQRLDIVQGSSAKRAA